MLPYLIEEDDPAPPGEGPGPVIEVEDEAEQVLKLAGAAGREEEGEGAVGDEGRFPEHSADHPLPAQPPSPAERHSSASSTSSSPRSEEEGEEEVPGAADSAMDAPGGTDAQERAPPSPPTPPVSSAAAPTAVPDSAEQGSDVTSSMAARPAPALAAAPALTLAPAPAPPAGPHRRRACPPPPPPPRRTGKPAPASDAASAAGESERSQEGIQSGAAPVQSLPNGDAVQGKGDEQRLSTLAHPSLSRPTRRRSPSSRKSRRLPGRQPAAEADKEGEAAAGVPQEAQAAKRRPSSHSTASGASRASARSARSCKSSRWMKKGQTGPAHQSQGTGERGPSLKQSASQLAERYLVRARRGTALTASNASDVQSPETKALAGRGGAQAGSRPPGRG